MLGEYGESLLRRCELREHSFAHCYDNGGMKAQPPDAAREPFSNGRQLTQVGGFNLSLMLRQLTGASTRPERKNRVACLFGSFVC